MPCCDMLLFKALIKQQMKKRHLTLIDITSKTGLSLNKVTDLVNNMDKYEPVMRLEKILTVLGVFVFDDENVNKTIKNEFKKNEKTHEKR